MSNKEKLNYNKLIKKAYLKSRNLKKFWNKIDKSNLSEDLVKTFSSRD